MADDVVLGVADFLANPAEPVLPRLRDSLLYGVQQEPDLEARMRAYARKLNVPPPAAMGDKDFVQAQGRVEDLDPNGMVLGSPKTADWLTLPDNAAVAHDDVANLSTIENLAAGIAERAARLGAGFLRGAGTAVDKPADFMERILPLGQIEFDDRGFRWRPTTAADVASPSGNMSQQAEALEGVSLGYAPGTTWEDVKKEPLSKVIPFALEQGVISIPDMIAALGSVPLYVTARTGEIGQTRAENDQRQDATLGDLMAALPAATASALMERFGAKGILGIDDAVRSLKDVPKAIGVAALKEGLTEGGQELVEGLGETVGTERGLNLGELADRVAAGIVGGAGYGGPVRGVTAGIQVATSAAQEKAAKVEQSQADNQTVSDMMAAAQGSALRARDPQTFQDFVDKATRDTPVENVYISAQDLVDTLAQGAPEQLAQNAQVAQAMPSIMAQIEEALPGNSLIEIPVSELLAFTPDAPMAQALMQNLKVDPQGMSMREAEAFMQTQGEELRTEVTRAVDQAAALDEFQASAERVGQNIVQQLNTANRFTADVNEAYGTLMSAFYATQAERLGVTPEQLFEQHPLTVRATGITGDVLTQPTETPEQFASRMIEEHDLRDFALRERSNGDLELEHIAVPTGRQGQGQGSAAMADLTAYADAAGKRLVLTPESRDDGQGSTPRNRLVRFYKRHGFVENKGRARDFSTTAGMIREPRTRGAFEQSSDADARGAFDPSSNLIVLLRNADLSTFLHEAGHFYLETLARLAADPNTPAEIREDWRRAAEFIGVPEADPATWLNLPVNERREGHEKWARAFEAYLREGKAPSTALQNVFRRFKAWLMHVYERLTQLNVELSDEVRGVFDRLLATEGDIGKAEALRGFRPIVDTKPEGLTDLEWESYQRLGAEATAEAQETLSARSIRDMQWLRNQRARIVRDLTKDAADKRKAVRAEVEAEVYSEPVYAAEQFLRRGTVNGEAWEGVHKLAIAEVAAIYEGTPADLQDWRKLGYGRYGMLAENGMPPDQAAELFGFSSGHELVEALLNADPVREVIEGRTDQRMLERYGDLSDAAAIERAADEAIHNEARLRFVATEANALAQAVGKRRVLAEAAKDFARDLIGRQRVRDLRPSKYTGAETRAAAAAARAAAKGDLVTAATEKRNQLVNAYAAKATYDALGEVEKALRYLARFESAATRKGMDPDYRDQIDALLERFDLRKGQSLKAIDKRKSLKAWIEAQQARGLDPVIDESLANEAYRKHYKDLTVDELRGLIDAVRNIAHLGRLKNKLLVAAQQREFQAVVDEAEAVIREKAYRTIPEKLERNTVADRVLSGFSNYFAIHRKFASLIREMQGLDTDGGILWRAFIEPMNKANDKEAVMREQATLALNDVFKTLPTKKGDLRRKLYIPALGKSLTLEGRLAVALNWGNELNRARILDGDRWSVDQVNAILKTLTPEQLGFVNAMWEYLDSYWPEIAAKERRVTGVEPEKVEPMPFEVTAADGSVVEMRGGYYPIKYDTERSSRSEADEIAETVRAALRGAYTRATTRRGHTKARVDKVERPVRKDLMVPFQHVNQVIHDLAFHEYLIDANRLISAPAIDAAIRDHYGVEVLRTIKKTLDDMAEGDIVAENSLERVVNHIRTGTTITGLGWNLATGLLQPLGLTQSIVRIGPKYVAKGIGRAFADAVTLENTMAAITEKSDFMRLRAKTMMREINEVQNQVRADWKPGGWGVVESSFFYLIQKLQLVADVPTWLGAYAKAQDQGVDEATAVALADQAVRDSQGSGQIGDLAQIQRGSVWFKLWTNFYSFFNIGYNQLAESIAETRRVGPGRLPYLAADILLIAFVPAVLGEMMKMALRGDEWDWEEIGPQLVKSQVSYLFGFMVGMREIGGIIQSDGQWAGGPAALRLLSQDLPRLYQQIQQGELDSTLRKTVLNAAGIIFHFPAGQINRTLDGFEAMAKGETSNPMALLLGPPREN